MMMRGYWHMLTKIMVIIIIIGSCAVSALQFFVHTLPKATITSQTTDAIVVTTGGQARLSAGLALLAAGNAPDLLLSGVGQGITKDIIADTLALDAVERHYLDCCITLEFQAEDTSGNALAAQIWVQENRYQSLILVTANYHMPRALLEFQKALPDTLILPHPISPPDLTISRWYNNWQTIRLLAREYLKFYYRKLSYIIAS